MKKFIRNSLNFIRAHADTLIGPILFCGGLYFYTITLAPTVLEGDKALFQYTPQVLGVTYPTGFPLYILLGKLWLTLFPFGDIAWRMNLFSALCAAATLPVLYGAIRRLLENRWAALTTVLIFATLPTFWHWSTVAKTYPLNMLLLAGVLYLLALALEEQNSTRITQLLALAVLLLGLQISVHNTATLLIPGLLLYAWLCFRPYLFNKKLFLRYALLLVLPGLFYLYIPLRAEWLIAQYGRDQAVARGLLADFYHSGLSGWITYFTAAEFTGGVVTKWGLIPERFVSVYVPLLVDNFTWPVIILALVGGLALAIFRPRIFWPLFLIYTVPIPFVLTYDQGEQSAFLLPSFLMIAIAVGGFVLLVKQLTPRNSQSASRFLTPLFFLAFITLLFLPQIQSNINWLEHKWDTSIHDLWLDQLNHPLEPNATLLAQWGDLTSFWYLQHAENRRPDLLGLYPPTETNVANWFAAGGQSLYIAGPNWEPGIEDHYQFIPWGRLVRVAPPDVDPATLLPDLPQSLDISYRPAGEDTAGLHLIKIDHPNRTAGGSNVDVTLTWQTVVNLPPDIILSLRLVQGDTIVAQLDNTLVSGWFSGKVLPADQYGLTYAPIPIPLGTLPGTYRLQLVIYTNADQPWVNNHGESLLDLADVEIVSPSQDFLPAHTDRILPNHDFNGEIELVDYSYSVSRLRQGKGFGLRFLWRAQQQPADNYTLLVEQLDAAGNVIRSGTYQPVNGQAPTSSWQGGQFIRDQIDLVIPASTPPGEQALQIRLSWLRPNGPKLNSRRWFIPIGDSLTLGWLDVIEKEGRIFEVPEIGHPFDTNLDNKVRFLGYNVTPDLKLNLGRLRRRSVSP